MLVSVGGRTRARLSIGDQSFQIVKIFDAKLSIFDGRKRERGKGGEGERERKRSREENTSDLARLGYGLIYRPVTRTRWTCWA